MTYESILKLGEPVQGEVMRITKDGVFVNPEVSVDHAARTVLEALDTQIKVLVQKAVVS